MAVPTRFIGVWALLLLTYSTAAGADDESSPKTTKKQQFSAQQIAQWAEHLGDAKFATREAASLRLLEAGLAARDELLQRINSSDPEVRDRSLRILASINERAHRQRVAAFLADPDDTKSHGLVGWPRFTSLVGKDRRSREMFVRLYDAEPLLLDALGGDARRLNEVFVARNKEGQAAIQGRIRAPGALNADGQTSLATAGAILFAASDPRVSLGDLDHIFSVPFGSVFAGAIPNSKWRRR